MSDNSETRQSRDGALHEHLDDDRIAIIIDGIEAGADPDAFAHVTDCAECRRRLAAVARLVDDPLIASEIDALEPAPKRALPSRSRKPIFVFAGLAAAAAATVVLLNPMRVSAPRGESAVDSSIHREAAITAAAAPQIISQGIITSDSLRWTGVAQADLYRVRIWDRAGNVVWTTETRDTVLAIPLQLVHKNGSYLLDVKARTGWDRWVSSSFAEFEIQSSTTR